MPSALVQEVVEHLEAMPPHLQEQVLSIVRSLDPTMPRGIAGSQLLQFAGTISNDDLEAMKRKIEAD